ncbi:MAG: hypothetical protein CL916_04535 [Deltaproteobacteria bacterium]|nr:hypothetical protein [Deltaproteobacteria bacterium]
MIFFIMILSWVHAAPLVIDFKDGTSQNTIQEIFGLTVEWIHPNSEDESLAYIKETVSEERKIELEQHELVEAVEESIQYKAFGEPNDPLYSQQWNLRMIGAEHGWKEGSGEGITVAVLDTGVAPVQDLNPKYLRKGVSFVSGESTSVDLNGHGTHVAGTIAQYTNNKYGAAGIAPKSTILPIKVLSKQGFGQSEWIASGIDEAVDQGADIINLSLGGTSSRVINVAIDKALKRNVIIIAAAGNTGKKGVSSPAKRKGVIAVSATDRNDDLAPYSTWGTEIFISAPGGNKKQKDGGIIQETISGDKNEFLEFQGTSMATPHVSGAVAILLGSGIQPQEIPSVLQKSAHDLGTQGHDPKFGYGRLDLAAALSIAVLPSISLFISLPSSILVASFAGFRFYGIFAFLATTCISGAFYLPWFGFSTSTMFEYPLHWGANIIGYPSLWNSILPPLIVSFFTLGYNNLRWIGALAGLSWSLYLFHLPGGWSIIQGILSTLLTILIVMIHRFEKQKN